jgi:hypothetical protein
VVARSGASRDLLDSGFVGSSPAPGIDVCITCLVVTNELLFFLLSLQKANLTVNPKYP